MKINECTNFNLSVGDLHHTFLVQIVPSISEGGGFARHVICTLRIYWTTNVQQLFLWYSSPGKKYNTVADINFHIKYHNFNH